MSMKTRKSKPKMTSRIWYILSFLVFELFLGFNCLYGLTFGGKIGPDFTIQRGRNVSKNGQNGYFGGESNARSGSDGGLTLDSVRKLKERCGLYQTSFCLWIWKYRCVFLKILAYLA